MDSYSREEIENVIRDPTFKFETFRVGFDNQAYSLPYSKVPNEIKDISTNEECAICSEPFTQDQDVTILACRHMYHKDCYTRWGKSCPMCRREVNQVTYLDDTAFLAEEILGNWRISSINAEMNFLVNSRTRRFMTSNDMQTDMQLTLSYRTSPTKNLKR